MDDETRLMSSPSINGEVFIAISKEQSKICFLGIAYMNPYKLVIDIQDNHAIEQTELRKHFCRLPEVT